MIRGLSTSVKDNLLLGAGAFYKNFEIGTDTPATATSKLLGATDGGGSFTVTQAIRQVSVDGAPSNIKGLEVNDGDTAVLVANVKEITAANIQLALNGSKTTSGTSTTITGKDIESTDYIDNITWAGSLSDGKVCYIQIKNVLSLNGLTLNMADKNEATIPLTLTAHYDLSAIDTPPYQIVIVG